MKVNEWVNVFDIAEAQAKVHAIMTATPDAWFHVAWSGTGDGSEFKVEVRNSTSEVVAKFRKRRHSR